jgi:streptogramin lyase
MKRGVLSAGISAVAALLVAAAPAVAAPTVAGEFALPAGSTVGTDNEIVAGPDGNMWVTTEANNVVRVTPAGTMTPFPLGADAFGITVGPDGNLWASQEVGIVKIDPATGTATATAIACAGCRGITSGPDGRIWMVGTNKLVSVNPANTADQATHVITTANAKGMTTDSNGLLWFADGDKVRSTTVAAPTTITDYLVGGGVQDVGAGPNGQVAYANAGENEVGLITANGTPQQIPVGTSDPFGVAFGADGAFWIARSSTDDLVRLATDGTFTTLPGFSNAPNVGPRKIAAGPANTLWVTLDEQESIAKVTGVDPPVTDPTPDPDPPGVAPTVEITSGPDRKVETDGRAKAKFKFSSATAGATFECALKKKGESNDAEDERAEFAACSSPKKYKRLRLGKYRFEVRATASGLVGAADSQRFKVVAK